jgi:hypothetical protein
MLELSWDRQDGNMLGYLLYDDELNIIAGCEPDCGKWSWYLPDWTNIHGECDALEEAMSMIESEILKINPAITFKRCSFHERDLRRSKK